MNDAPATKIRRYRVFVTTWSAYEQWVEAKSEDEALEIAEADYDENLDANWHMKNGGLDGFDVLDCEEIEENGGAQ